jgi:predicted nucleic acid-binding protein
VPSRRIADASPLILLTKVGRLDLLRLGEVDVTVPDVVAREIGVRGPGDPTVQAIQQAGWLIVVPTPPVPASVRVCNLDEGESGVLAVAVAEPGSEVVLDDRAARRCARALGVPVLGSVGLVLAAKRLGSIPAARPIVEDLRRAGLYLDDAFVAEALKRVGE